MGQRLIYYVQVHSVMTRMYPCCDNSYIKLGFSHRDIS